MMIFTIFQRCDSSGSGKPRQLYCYPLTVKGSHSHKILSVGVQARYGKFSRACLSILYSLEVLTDQERVGKVFSLNVPNLISSYDAVGYFRRKWFPFQVDSGWGFRSVDGCLWRS